MDIEPVDVTKLDASLDPYWRPKMAQGNSQCPRCLGEGYVCEFHPTLPWEHNKRCPGGGVNCVLCNPYRSAVPAPPTLPLPP